MSSTVILCQRPSDAGYNSVMSSCLHRLMSQKWCCNAGKQLAVRPVLEATSSDTHGWSLGASDGDHNVRLDAMDEGLTRLVASLPSDNAEAKGDRATSWALWAKQNDTSLLNHVIACCHPSPWLECYCKTGLLR